MTYRWRVGTHEKSIVVVNIPEAQRLLCDRVGCVPNFVVARDKLGVAPSLFGSELPVVGVRYLPTKDTCGWYIWAGDYSEDPDFFQSQHAEHVFAVRPEVVDYLGLPPGWGFIIAPGYEDVWQDDTLLVE